MTTTPDEPTALAASTPDAAPVAASWPAEDEDGPTAGWGYIRPGDRRAHFYDAGSSLCGKVGFYTGALEPVDSPPSPQDCKPCRRLVDRRAS